MISWASNISEEEEAEEYRQKWKKSGIPKNTRQSSEKRLPVWKLCQPMMAGISHIRNYLDWVFDIPWTEESKDNLDLEKTKQMLDEDHYGLKRLRKNSGISLRTYPVPESKGPILCFVGPPGVGQGPVWHSPLPARWEEILQEFPLAAWHDEAEIRGHRRTYIGAMPGRFIEAMQQAKTINPFPSR